MWQLRYYWWTTERFFYARARREAHPLSVLLFWAQTAVDIKGLRGQFLADQDNVFKALLRHWNIHDTAHLDTLLPLGQRVIVTVKISVVAGCHSAGQISRFLVVDV